MVIKINRIMRYIFFCLILVIISCATAQQNSGHSDGKDVSAIADSKSLELLNLLKDINSNSPETIKSAFTADGNTPGKKFRIEGTAVFDRKGYYYLSMTDYVFKSPVIKAYRDLDKLYFFYPADKKLLADDINRIDFYRYSGFNADFRFILTLFTGGVPVLKDYTVNRVLKEGDSSFFLILENSEYFENIYFKEKVPEKIMLIHKQSREKAEIYLDSSVKRDKSLFFRKIRIAAPGLGVSMQISFSKPVLNEPVKVEKVESLKNKKGIEVIKIN